MDKYIKDHHQITSELLIADLQHEAIEGNMIHYITTPTLYIYKLLFSRAE